MKVKSESEAAQLCPALRDSVDYSLPGSSVHGIFQARALEWVAIAFLVLICTDSRSLDRLEPGQYMCDGEKVDCKKGIA